MINWEETKKRFGYDKCSKHKKVVVICEACGLQKVVYHSTHINSMKRRGKYLCIKCANKDPKTRASRKRAMQEYFASPKGVAAKTALRERAIKQWQNPEYRTKMKEMQSQNSRKMWKAKRDKLMKTFSSKSFKKKMSIINKEIDNRPEVKEKKSKASKELWKNQKYRKYLEQLYETKEYREKQRQMAQELWRSQEYREKQLQSEYIRDRSNASKKRWLDKDYRLTMSQKWAQRFVKLAQEIHNDKYTYKLDEYFNSNHHITIICPVHGPFKQLPKLHIQGCGCPRCVPTVSSGHQDVVDYIKSLYCGEITINNRNIIAPLELDIYLPKIRLGIEFNGTYWHSLKHPMAHQRKHLLCLDNNIILLQIDEHLWKKKRKWFEKLIKDRIEGRPLIYDKSKDIVLVDARYDDGSQLLQEGYKLIRLTKPYKIRLKRYTIYDAGRYIYKKVPPKKGGTKTE